MTYVLLTRLSNNGEMLLLPNNMIPFEVNIKLEM